MSQVCVEMPMLAFVRLNGLSEVNQHQSPRDWAAYPELSDFYQMTDGNTRPVCTISQDVALEVVTFGKDQFVKTTGSG